MFLNRLYLKMFLKLILMSSRLIWVEIPLEKFRQHYKMWQLWVRFELFVQVSLRAEMFTVCLEVPVFCCPRTAKINQRIHKSLHCLVLFRWLSGARYARLSTAERWERWELFC